MTKHNIAIFPLSFLAWGGGFDFLKNYLRAFSYLHKEYNVYLFYHRPRLKEYIYYGLRYLTGRFKGTSLPLKPWNEKRIKRKLQLFDNLFCISYSGEKDAKRIIVKEKIELIFLHNDPIQGLDIPIVGYIPDLQHIHFPHFFLKKERCFRDKLYTKVLLHSTKVLVNSLDTQNDIRLNYPEISKSKIYSMPFIPIASPLDIDVSLSKYSLPERYFLISNQFWVHKNHQIAFDALAILVKKGYADIYIICTGDTSDYRIPDYFDNLCKKLEKNGIKSYITFLGYIPKEDMIAIMKKSIALIQPTLFEGGPGGGAVYEAIANGVPIILSNIPINHEVRGNNIFLFNVYSSEDLAEKMISMIETPLLRPSLEDLLDCQKINFTQFTSIVDGLLKELLK